VQPLNRGAGYDFECRVCESTNRIGLCGRFGLPEIIRPSRNLFLKTFFVRARVVSDLEFVIDNDTSGS
jgi:hypothetical protein